MSRRYIILAVLIAVSGAPAVDTEVRFIEGLTEAGFPELAQKVLSRTLRSFPDAERFAPELQLRILIAGKRFDEAQAQLAVYEDAPALWRFLADTAFRARQSSVADAAYRKFFESVKPSAAPDAVYQFGMLLEERGNLAGARELYEAALDGAGDDKLIRPIKVRLAQIISGLPDVLQNDLTRARKLCEEVQLGGLDLWFGQSVITWSRIMQLCGEWSEATDVLETQLELLYELEQNLARQNQPVATISPLAGARYYLGLCYEHAGRNADALTQLYNVYAKYGGSEWGPDAQEHSQKLIEQFERAGRTVKIEYGNARAGMEENAFRVPRRLFFEKNYSAAAPEYLAALNRYPESAGAIPALRELTQCFIFLNDSFSAKAAAAYIAERFGDKNESAIALLAAAKTALDEKQNELSFYLYENYLRQFPRHERAAGVLFSLAALQRSAGDEAAEAKNLMQILKHYPASPFAPRALGRLAWNMFDKEEYSRAVKRFERYIPLESDFRKCAAAQFALAESFRFQDEWPRALSAFQELETSLADSEKSYGFSEESAQFNRPYFEKALFYQGVCFSRMNQFSEAVTAFDRFIERCPAAEFIPAAKYSKGVALMDMQYYTDALNVFSEFDENSGKRFFEPVCYYRGVACFEIGAFNDSIEHLETLLNRFPESSFFFEAKLLQGRAFTQTARNADAVRVLSDVLNFSSDDLLIYRATLELGRAQPGVDEKLASFQRVALLADPQQYSEMIAAALEESLPLYLQLNRPLDLLADADRLLNEFPDYANRKEVEELQQKAKRLTTNEHESEI